MPKLVKMQTMDCGCPDSADISRVQLLPLQLRQKRAGETVRTTGPGRLL